MKILTSVTLVMVIPEIIAGLFGMNVQVPMGDTPYAFWIIIGLIVMLCLMLILFLNKKDMF